MKKLSILLFAAICAVTAKAAIDITVVSNGATAFYQQANSSALVDGSLVRVGYFNEANIAGFSAGDWATLATVEAQFTELTTFAAASGNVLGTNSGIAHPGNTGAPLYTWVFNAATTGAATEWGVFGSSSWTVPADLGTAVMTATQINNIKFGATSGGHFQMAAVPEPSTYAMIFGGIALGFGIYRRRKQKA